MYLADEINHKTGEYHRSECSRYGTAAVDMADATYADNARKFLNGALGILVILREPRDSRRFVSYLFPIARETRLGRYRVLRKGRCRSKNLRGVASTLQYLHLISTIIRRPYYFMKDILIRR